jgi:hypothetical protein
MIELSDSDVVKIGRLISDQHWEMVRIKKELKSSRNMSYRVLFYISVLIAALLRGSFY